MKPILIAMTICAAFLVSARSISLRPEKAIVTDKKKNAIISEWSNETKFRVAELKLGRNAPKDPTNDVKLVYATVVKNAQTKKTYFNDIQTFKFAPELVPLPVTLRVVSGSFESRRDSADKRWTRGWMAEGVVVEYWANGKMIKRLATFSGPLATASLTELDKLTTKPLYLGKKSLYEDSVHGYDTPPSSFDNRTLLMVGDTILE